VKSLFEINLDYAKAIRQAEQLEAVASELTSLAGNDFQGCLNNIANNWKGENSQAYIRKGTKLKGDMENSAKQLRMVARTIRNIAERTRRADLAARAIALASGG